MSRIRIHDGLTKRERWDRKPADVVVCPTCQQSWQRTNSQRSDGSMCCSQRCAAHFGNIGRSLRASRDAVVRYQQIIRARLQISENQARDVEVRDIVLLMLEARKDGLGLGIQRGLSRAKRNGLGASATPKRRADAPRVQRTVPPSVDEGPDDRPLAFSEERCA